jgi:hypothetical protein
VADIELTGSPDRPERTRFRVGRRWWAILTIWLNPFDSLPMVGT